ncbi:hypothetical protein D3C73_1261220 [compost metagenome]
MQAHIAQQVAGAGLDCVGLIGIWARADVHRPVLCVIPLGIEALRAGRYLQVGVLQAHLRQQASGHQFSEWLLLRACRQVTEQPQAGVRIAALGTVFGAGLPVSEELQRLLVGLDSVRELQGQASGAVRPQFEHTGLTQRRAGKGWLVVLGRCVEIKLAFGAGQRGKGSGVGFAQ